jgi:hypothetical protein
MSFRKRMNIINSNIIGFNFIIIIIERPKK